MTWRTALILNCVLLALLSLQCGPKKSYVLLDPKRISPQELIQNVLVNAQNVRTLIAQGGVSLETPRFSNSGSISVWLKKPDSLLVKLEGPFGLNVGTMLLTKRNFLFYDSFNNRLISGETSKLNIHSLLRLDMDFPDILDVFCGTLTFDKEHTTPSSIVVDNNQYLLTFHTEEGDTRYWVDPEYFTISRYVLFDKNQSPVFEQSQTDFIESRGAIVPQSITIIAHRERRRFSLSYDEIEINKPNVSFSFVIPESAKRIYW